MVAPVVLFWINVAVTAASMAYQADKAHKARKKAREAAEARKGFDVVVEGEVMRLPIVYGRAKVGGVRVFHGTKNSFEYVEPNSDPASRFLTGTPDTTAQQWTGWSDNGGSPGNGGGIGDTGGG
jgi:hypothetical protein